MSEPLLTVEDLRVHFKLSRGLPGSHPDILHAVDGVDMQVFKGETLGLVGESGCGKSTLARCIVGLFAPTTGTMAFKGSPLQAKRTQVERRQIQMVFQDPYSSLNPRMTVGQTLGELLRVHRIVPRREVNQRCKEVLEVVGLPADALHAYPRQFSGGQRQRIGIARALILQPELLIADEPVSALDVSIQASILNLLQTLQQELGLTMVFIAHNLAVVRHICDRVAVMYLGRIVELAETEELFSDPRHPYTQGLLAAIPRLAPRAKDRAVAVLGEPPSPLNIPSGCRFRSRCPIAKEVCTESDPSLGNRDATKNHLAACHFAWPAGLPERA